jgi:hypothetical protein
MQRTLRTRKAFYGLDMLALRRHCERKARQHSLAVNVDGASAALTLIASFLRPCQMKMVAQGVEDGHANVQCQVSWFTVDHQPDGDRPLGGRSGGIRRPRGEWLDPHRREGGGTACDDCPPAYSSHMSFSPLMDDAEL